MPQRQRLADELVEQLHRASIEDPVVVDGFRRRVAEVLEREARRQAERLEAWDQVTPRTQRLVAIKAPPTAQAPPRSASAGG